MLQHHVRELHQDCALKACHRCRRQATGRVSVHYSKARRRARYGGLQTCGKAWLCPICGHSKSLENAARIQHTLAVPGIGLVHAVYTMRHRATDELPVLLKTIRKAKKELHEGTPYKTTKGQFHILGQITAFEVTHNSATGFHPHYHVLYIMAEPIGDHEALQDRLSKRWRQVIGDDRMGAKGVHIEQHVDRKQIPRYMTKLLRVDLRELERRRDEPSRRPCELVYDSLNGKADARGVFRHYARAIEGFHFIDLGRSLKQKLAAFLPEHERQAYLEWNWKDNMPQSDRMLMSIEIDDWQKILRQRKQHEVLEVAAKNDSDLLYEYIQRL